jgi:hypothetical protein
MLQQIFMCEKVIIILCCQLPSTLFHVFICLQAYEKQIKELNKQVKKLEEEKELIKLDVGAR